MPKALMAPLPKAMFRACMRAEAVQQAARAGAVAARAGAAATAAGRAAVRAGAGHGHDLRSQQKGRTKCASQQQLQSESGCEVGYVR